MLESAKSTANSNTATLFAYAVKDPERYGVVSFNADGNPTKIIEKPTNPESNYAVTGLYFYPNDVVEIAKNIKPSARGELEITTVNQIYLEQKRVAIQKFGRGFAWLDTGTPESMHDAANFIQSIQNRQGVQVAALEEISFRKGWITAEQLLTLAEPMSKNDYGKYLIQLAKNGVK